MPRIFHQTQSMVFLAKLCGFGTPFGLWSWSNHCDLRLVLSYMIHFSLLVKIDSIKPVFFDSKRRLELAVNLWSLFFSESSWGSHLPSLLTFPISLRPLIIVRWLHSNLLEVKKGSASTVSFKTSRSRHFSRPWRGRSWSERSPDLNLSNHFRQLESLIAYLP